MKRRARRRGLGVADGGGGAAVPAHRRAGHSTGTTDPSYLAAFVQALRKFGWVDGQNLRLDIRWHENDPACARAFATELVAIDPDVILTAATSNLAILHGSTRAIPIVFLQISDPVAQGFITSLARPGGNITSFTAFESAMGGKWLDLLKQISPSLARVAVLFHPTHHGTDCITSIRSSK